jgi:RNA polymerase sigma-70 factor (ECF subfamily)
LKFEASYPSEDSFVAFKKKQDASSFACLYKQWGHLVYGVALKYLANKEDARDAVTDIFERLWTEIPQHDVSNWKSWLYSVTKFHCLMQLRSRKAKYKNLLNDPWETDENWQEKEPWWQAIENAAHVLKQDQKTCIHLFFWEGMSYENIALNQGMTLSAVKSHIQNGKRNMRIWIEQHHGKP